MFRRLLITTSFCAGSLLLGLGTSPSALALSAPTGWQEQRAQGVTTFTPKKLNGKPFSLVVSDPMPMQGLSLSRWAPQAVDSVSSSHDKVLSRGKPEFKAPLWTVQHEVVVNGQRFTAIYHAFVHAPDQARLTVMLGSPEAFGRHAPTAADIIAAAVGESRTGTAGRRAAKASTEAGTGRQKEAADATDDTSASADEAPSSPSEGKQGKNRFAFSAGDIQTILNHAETSYDVYGLEVIETTHVLLKDGRLYTNGKANGSWRKSGKGYQYQAAKGGKGWQTLNGDPTLGISAKTLPGSYNADRGHSFGGTTAVTRNRIHFYPDGRYETDHYFSGHTQMGDGITTPKTTTTVGKGKGNRQGRYRLLNQYALELKGDDGSVRQVIAYFTDDKREWLNLNETAYQRK